MTIAQMLTSEAPRLRSPTLALRVLGLLGTALACNGSVDTQTSASSPRAGTEAPSGATPAPSPPLAGSNRASDTDPTGGSGEEADIVGISNGSTARGGARGAARRPVVRADAGELEADAGELDAGADDGGVNEVDAGADDAGVVDAAL